MPEIGRRAQVRGVSISFYVAANRQEVSVTLNREGLVAALVQVPFAGCVIVRVVTLRVSQAEPLTESTHFTVHLRTHNQVPVLGIRQ